jgi:N-acyl-phosphatidylethanolamine-hydrolysing phospholipase D
MEERGRAGSEGMKQLEVFGSLVLILFLSSCMHKQVPFDEAKWRKQVEGQSVEKLYAPHFKDGRYFNPWMPMEHGGFWRFVKWKFSQKAEYTKEEEEYKPKFIPGMKKRIRSMPAGDFISWIGHGTFLLRLQGEYWLTDPIFSERALLPKRVTPPAMAGKELRDLAPRVNVLISHNHYDHLDVESIRSLPEDSRIYLPLGLKNYVESFHKGPVQELDWWQEIKLGEGKKIICLPAQHWSRRIGQGHNETLWASFLLITPGVTIYYGADSGYFIGYREFGKKFPNIDYALLATTAYHPRWFMHYAHVNIPEVLDAFHDLGAHYFIPAQWGTFPLGDEPPGYPALDLRRTIRERNLDPSHFRILDIGQIEPIRKASRTGKG